MGSVRTGSDNKEEMRDKATLPPGRTRDARADHTDHGSPPGCSAGLLAASCSFTPTLSTHPARLRSHLERLLPGHLSPDKATPLS